MLGVPGGGLPLVQSAGRSRSWTTSAARGRLMGLLGKEFGIVDSDATGVFPDEAGVGASCVPLPLEHDAAHRGGQRRHP